MTSEPKGFDPSVFNDRHDLPSERLFFSTRGSLTFVSIAKTPAFAGETIMHYYNASLDRRYAMKSSIFFQDFSVYDPNQTRHAELFAKWIERSYPGTIDRLIKQVGIEADHLANAYRGLAMSQSEKFDFF